MHHIRKIFSLLALLVALVWPAVLAAQTTPGLNAGFVNGIWYSKSPFFAGDEIRIYSAIQNSSPYDLIGKLRFLDGEKLIGETDFSVIKGQVVQRWVDWKVSEGSHAIFASITEAKKSEIGKPPEPIELSFAASGRDERLVDVDTDKDGTGNVADTDDDNDGATDSEETVRGTNPLLANTTALPIAPAEAPSTTTLAASMSELAARLAEEAKEKILALFNKQSSSSISAATSATVGETAATEPATAELATNIFVRAWENIKAAFDRQVVERAEERLREKDMALEEEIKTGTETTPLLADEISKIEEKTPFKIPQGKKPTLEHIYRWLIAAAIYVINSKWMLVIVGLIMLRLLYKLFKLLHGRDADEER